MTITKTKLPRIQVYADALQQLSLTPEPDMEPVENPVDVGVDAIHLYVFMTYAEARAFVDGVAQAENDSRHAQAAPVAGYGVALVATYDDPKQNGIFTTDRRHEFAENLAHALKGLTAHERLDTLQRLHAAIDAV